MLISAVAFIVVFGVLVLAHEVGHFVMARRAGVVVEEFGFGFPPRLKTLCVRGGVEYTLNAIPLGGFVRMLGEDDPNKPGSFASKSAGARLGILLAGPAMSLALAVVLFTCTMMLGEQVVTGNVIVVSVAPNAPAERAGVRPGDIVLAIEGHEIDNPMDLVAQARLLREQEISLSVLRDDERLTFHLTPRADAPEDEGAMGVAISMEEGYEVRTVRYPLWEAFPRAMREVWTAAGSVFEFLSGIVRGSVSAKEISGPVGILHMSGAVARTGIVNLMYFAAFLSVNFCIVNLFPLPALDGGRIVFILLELLRGGKRIASYQQGFVHFVGMLLILAFTLVISYFDIARILTGATPLP